MLKCLYIVRNNRTNREIKPMEIKHAMQMGKEREKKNDADSVLAADSPHRDLMPDTERV